MLIWRLWVGVFLFLDILCMASWYKNLSWCIFFLLFFDSLPRKNKTLSIMYLLSLGTIYHFHHGLSWACVDWNLNGPDWFELLRMCCFALVLLPRCCFCFILLLWVIIKENFQRFIHIYFILKVISAAQQ